MKTKKYLTLIVLLIALITQAQVKLGGEIGPWLPISTFSPTGFLVNLKSRFGISDNVFLGANIGFVFNSGTTLIPASGTIEYYMAKKGFKPFLGVDAGYFLNTGGAAFMAPAAGFAIAVQNNIDISARVSMPVIFYTGGASISMPIAIGTMYKF